MKGFGETDDRKKTIRINERKSLAKGGRNEVRDTIEHEILHAKRQASGRRNTEAIVYPETKRKLAAMSNREKEKLDTLIK